MLLKFRYIKTKGWKNILDFRNVSLKREASIAFLQLCYEWAVQIYKNIANGHNSVVQGSGINI